MSRWKNWNTHPRNDHTHASSISFHDTFARKRTRTNRSNVFYRFFAFAKFFFYIAAFARLVQQFVFSEKKKKDFQNPFFLETNKTKTRALSKGFKTRRERAERERKARARQRERKKEGTRTGGFTGSLFGTGHCECLFLCRFFLFSFSDDLKKII